MLATLFSFWDLEEIMAERNVVFNYATLNRLVAKKSRR